MTEDEARVWIEARFPEHVVALERMVALVLAENEQQNLIAPSTTAMVWSRHMVDSLQLIHWANEQGTWLDVGTGGGFPGLAIAVVRCEPMILVEPRRRRAEFLTKASELLGLSHVTVLQAKVEAVRARADIISARAVAPVATLVEATRHVALPSTRWLLPRGRFEPEEQAALAARGIMFHVEHSATEAGSRIVVIQNGSKAA